MKIRLRKARLKDRRDVLSWRNDPSTRKVSFNTRAVTLREHTRWFSKAIKDKDKRIYIGENRKYGKLGMVRLDKLGQNAAEISVNVAPAMRGKGYGPAFISAACKKSGFKVVFARTKESNLPSVKAFLRAGFLTGPYYKNERCETVKVLIWVIKK